MRFKKKFLSKFKELIKLKIDLINQDFYRFFYTVIINTSKKVSKMEFKV